MSDNNGWFHHKSSSREVVCNLPEEKAKDMNNLPFKYLLATSLIITVLAQVGNCCL